MEKLVIAIDGPAGSGKSTVAKALAKKYNVLHLNTGSIYRAFSLFCLENGIDVYDQDAVEQAVQKIDLQIKFQNNEQIDVLNGRVVTSLLRQESISNASSVVSQYANVRRKAVELQRQIADKMSVIVEGRDITSVVLPNASFKFFITAGPQVRAKRRYDENIQKGIPCDYDTILQDIKERDLRDQTRKNSPLVVVKDAVVIDTTDLNIDQVVQRFVSVIEKRQKSPSNNKS